MPFKVAQEALEGQNYVNLSLLPIMIKKLRDSLHMNQGAIDNAEQPQFHSMLSKIDRGQITGVPKLAFWVSMLDPGTKNSTLKILSIRDKREIWEDIQNAIITIRQQEGVPDGNAPNNVVLLVRLAAKGVPCPTTRFFNCYYRTRSSSNTGYCVPTVRVLALCRYGTEVVLRTTSTVKKTVTPAR